MHSWQEISMGLRYGDNAYIPLSRIRLPAQGTDPREEGDNLRLLHLLRLFRGQPLPPESPLPPYCRNAVDWLEVPLVVVDGRGTACLLPVLLGRLQETDIIIEEGWLTPRAEAAAREALALGGQGECGFVLLPLRSPGSLQTVDGPSLGLPLAVAALRQRTGKGLPAQTVMTGEVDAAGHVLPVAHVREKWDCARKGQYPAQIFLYPAGRPPLDNAPCAVPVKSLTEIETLLDTASLDGAICIAHRLGAWRDAPENLFSWLASPDTPQEMRRLLLRLMERDHWCDRMSEAALLTALGGLDRMWQHICKDRELCTRFLALFPYERVRHLPASLDLLRLAEKNKTQANHRGEDAAHWRALSDRCVEGLKHESGGIGLAEIGQRVRTFIGIWHNAYRFHRDDIPASWLEKIDTLARCLDCAELGKAYGFLVHQMAFCGDHDQALLYAARSLSFLPDGEQQRRHIDRIHIFLECGQVEDACREMDTILDLWRESRQAGDAPQDEMLPAHDRAAAVVQMDDPFVHAAFVRLCLAMPGLLHGYPVADLLRQARPYHPWQLWACNCGRLLAGEDPGLARRCLRFSCDCCLKAGNGVTLEPMALMPLSVLAATGLLPREEIRATTEDVIQRLRDACAAGQLHAPHFQPLLDLPDADAVLSEVAAHTSRYFPFNYH